MHTYNLPRRTLDGCTHTTCRDALYMHAHTYNLPRRTLHACTYNLPRTLTWMHTYNLPRRTLHACIHTTRREALTWMQDIQPAEKHFTCKHTYNLQRSTSKMAGVTMRSFSTGRRAWRAEPAGRQVPRADTRGHSGCHRRRLQRIPRQPAAVCGAVGGVDGTSSAGCTGSDGRRPCRWGRRRRDGGDTAASGRHRRRAAEEGEGATSATSATRRAGDLKAKPPAEAARQISLHVRRVGGGILGDQPRAQRATTCTPEHHASSSARPARRRWERSLPKPCQWEGVGCQGPSLSVPELELMELAARDPGGGDHGEQGMAA